MAPMSTPTASPRCAAEPPGQHLEGDRVDRRDPDAAERAQRQRRHQVHGEERERGVRAQQRGGARGHEAMGRDDVGGTGQRDRERPDGEPDLDRHGEQRDLEPADVPLLGDERRDGRRAEPRRQSDEQADAERGKGTPAPIRLSPASGTMV